MQRFNLLFISCTILLGFYTLTINAACSNNVCDCSKEFCVGIGIASVCKTVGACDIPGVSEFQSNVINPLKNQINSLTNDVNSIISQIEQSAKIVTFLEQSGTNIADSWTNNINGLEDAFKDGFKALASTFKPTEHFAELLHAATEIGDGFGRSIEDIIEALSSTFIRVLSEPGQGVWDKVQGDCLYQSWQDGSISFGAEYGPPLSVAFSLTFANIQPAKCLVTKANQGVTAFVNAWDTLFGAIPFNKFLDALVALDNALVGVTNDWNTFRNTSFCTPSTYTVSSTTVDGPDFLQPLADALNVIAQAGSTNGPLGSLSREISQTICNLKVPEDLAEFSSNLNKFVSRSRSFAPKGLATKFFRVVTSYVQGIENFLDKFTPKGVEECAQVPLGSDFSCDLINKFGNASNCFLTNLVNDQYQFTVGVGISVDIIPPISVTPSLGFSSSSIDAWLCLADIVPSTKRATTSSYSSSLEMFYDGIIGGDPNGPCTTVTCPSGQTQDLDTCACVTDPSAIGSNGGAIAAGILIPLILIGGAVGGVFALKILKPEKYNELKGKILPNSSF